MGKRILVAVEDPFFFDACADALRKAGFTVDPIFMDVPPFLAALRGGGADLVIVVGGPLGNWGVLEDAGFSTRGGCTAGFAVVDWARQEGILLPAIFLSTTYHYRFVTNTTVVDRGDVLPYQLVAMVQKILA